MDVDKYKEEVILNMMEELGLIDSALNVHEGVHSTRDVLKLVRWAFDVGWEEGYEEFGRHV
jgi:hypothetical protein